jgi:TfoX/Sxy family transcriptional regulator of competence genes
MTSKQSTVDFILDQLADAGVCRARKMFGDYALYCDGKVVGLICDDQLFIKYTDPGKAFAQGRYTEGCAYPGAKPSMNVTDVVDDREFLVTLVRMTADTLPRPAPKKKKV